MNRRSTTNSRPLENLDLRRLYREQNPDCELHKMFPCEFQDPSGEEVHHIVSVHQRPDLLSNLLVVSWDAHQFCTNKPNAGRVVALFVKVRKGEMDVSEDGEFHRASGFLLPGYLLKIGQKIEVEWVRPFLETLISEFP